jgi:S1-C subfamily serine protease
MWRFYPTCATAVARVMTGLIACMKKHRVVRLGTLTLILALEACRAGSNSDASRQSAEPAPAETRAPSTTAPPAIPPPAGSPPAGSPPPQAPPVAPPSPGARIEDERNTIAVFREAAPAVVFVTQTQVLVDYWGGVTQEVPAGSGSGFVWDQAGHIVTNYHVVESARRLTVTFHNQQTFEAKVVGVEPRKDIAVLLVEAPKELLKPVHAMQHIDLEVGQKTIAIGNPFGLDHTLTTGVVSALGRQVKGIGEVTIRDMIQTDAAINPGNSGGPLLDSSGRLIGMNTMIFSKSGTSAGIGFAVPASTIQRIVPQIIKSGRAEQLGLGIQVDRRLERQLGIRGVVVLAVVEGTPAAKAGLRGISRSLGGVTLGDVIVGIGPDKVDDYDDLYNALDKHRAGETVDVKVLRGKEVVTLKIEVIALP